MEENKNTEPEQPAENIPEAEHGEIPPSSGEIISSEQTTVPETKGHLSTLNLSTETSAKVDLKPLNDTMETHALQLHHAPGKKFRHYLFEFFMLFLAVTLGFFIENQREHYIEKKRAKEYARLLADDLSFDISELNRAERVLNTIITAGDSLGLLLSNNDVRKIPGGKIYYYEYWSGWRWSIISRDATLQQLKNSGTLRYLSNIELVRKILSYEESIRLVYMLQNKYEPEKAQNWNLVQKVFNQDYFNILDNDPALARDSTVKNFNNSERLNNFLNSNYPLYNYDKNILFELKNWAYNSSRNYRVIVNDIKILKAKAHDVIEALKKEYHLK